MRVFMHRLEGIGEEGREESGEFGHYAGRRRFRLGFGFSGGNGGRRNRDRVGPDRGLIRSFGGSCHSTRFCNRFSGRHRGSAIRTENASVGKFRLTCWTVHIFPSYSNRAISFTHVPILHNFFNSRKEFRKFIYVFKRENIRQKFELTERKHMIKL